MYVYRFLWEEKKFYLHHTIDTNGIPLEVKEKTTEKKKDVPVDPPKVEQSLDEYPTEAKISREARYVGVTLFNGSV